MTIDSFWGPYRFLSNFGPGSVEMDGHSYLTSEHAYQAAKTLDEEERKIIREATTPGRAKRLGKKVSLRSDWNDVRLDVMENILRQKFQEGTENADLLLKTGDEELVEGNTWGDTFWGMCRGEGENHLGKILMKIREDLKS